MANTSYVTRLMVRKNLVQYGLAHKSNSDIDTAMANVDQEDIFSQERAKLNVLEWDRSSPINGVDAQQVIVSHNIPVDGTAYLIKEGERVVAFQSRSRVTGNVITSETALSEGSVHADEIARQRATPIVIESVIDQLDV